MLSACGASSPGQHVEVKAKSVTISTSVSMTDAWAPLKDHVRFLTAYKRAVDVNEWNDAVRKAELAEHDRHRRVSIAAPLARNVGLGSCGGDLPSCSIVQGESGGDYNAYNPTGCYAVMNGVTYRGCVGKYQFGEFWAGKLGLPADIRSATPEQQDNAARILWNHGAGCSNWRC